MAVLKKLCGKLFRFLLPERIFDFEAPIYANAAKNAKTLFYETVVKEIVERINQRGNVKNFLDIGTGPGFMLLKIAELRPDLDFVGVDLSKKLIEIAAEEKKCRFKNAIPNVIFEMGNANHLRFKNDTFDFAISSGVLHSLKNPSAAIREWFRILKPGGDLWIYDPTVLFNEGEMDNSDSFEKILENSGKILRKKDRLLFYIFRRLIYRDLPPRPMSLEKVVKIIKDAGVIDSTAIEDRKHYLKIAIKKKRYY